MPPNWGKIQLIGFFLTPTLDAPNVVVEVPWSLLVRTMVRGHCCHRYAPKLLCPIATPGSPWGKNQCSMAESNIRPPMQWRGYKPTTLSSEGICAYAQPLLNLSSQLIHAVMRISNNPRPSHQRELVHTLVSTTTATWQLRGGINLLCVLARLFLISSHMDEQRNVHSKNTSYPRCLQNFWIIHAL